MRRKEGKRAAWKVGREKGSRRDKEAAAVSMRTRLERDGERC